MSRTDRRVNTRCPIVFWIEFPLLNKTRELWFNAVQEKHWPPGGVEFTERLDTPPRFLFHRRFSNSAYRRVVGKHDGDGHTEHALAHHDVTHSVVHVV